MKEREKFEEWTREFYSDLACASATWSDEKGTYTDYAHHMAWHLWQELQSRLEELNREVDWSEKENRYLNDGCAELEAHIQFLEEENASLKQDATRMLYHIDQASIWLKSNSVAVQVSYALAHVNHAMQANKGN